MPVQTQIQVRRSTAASWTSTNPTLAAGEIGFETDTGKFKIGTGSSVWTALTYAGGGSQATLITFQYTATSGQTTFSGVDANGNTLAYVAGSAQVYLNGVLLVVTSDYTASNGTSVVLASGAVTGDILTVIALGTFTVSTDIPKSTLTDKGSIVTATAASTPSNLSVGSNDQVLTADSTTATGLKWASVASGGLTLLSTTNLSGTSTTVSSISQAYTNLIVIVNNPFVNVANPLRVRINGGASIQTSGVISGTAGNQTELRTDPNNLPIVTGTTQHTLDIYNYANTSFGKAVFFRGAMTAGNSSTSIAGSYTVATAVTSIEITTVAGTATFSGGQVLIYGVK